MKRLYFACLLSVGVLAGCEQYHQTRTGWIDQGTPYPTSLVEYIRGEDGVDIGAALAADFSALGLDVHSETRPDGTVILTMHADEFGANRSEQLALMDENIEAMNGRVDSYGNALDGLVEQLKLLGIIP